MIKLVYCIRKHASLSSEDFSKYWLNQHAELMRQEAERIGACRYVQSHSLASTASAEQSNRVRGSTLPPYDGITEIWWQCEADMLPSAFTKEALIETQKKLLADEKNFIDTAQSVIFMTEEYEIFNFSA